MLTTTLRILWPAFLAAGVLEIMVFAVLDPLTLSLMGRSMSWSREAVYSVTFLIFWAMFTACSTVTLLLARTATEVNAHLRHSVASGDE